MLTRRPKFIIEQSSTEEGMIRYHIKVNVGNEDRTVKFQFIHKDWDKLSKEQQDGDFDKAVHELEDVYKKYGRFATEIGVARLFETFGFERSPR